MRKLQWRPTVAPYSGALQWRSTVALYSCAVSRKLYRLLRQGAIQLQKRSSCRILPGLADKIEFAAATERDPFTLRLFEAGEIDPNRSAAVYKIFCSVQEQRPIRSQSDPAGIGRRSRASYPDSFGERSHELERNSGSRFGRG